ncbi:hypothetical protein ATCC90586_011972 [Pythium insidiosum]|nr:hypothetical protein ATCC90586_011972 [Pythium insidiosum]
MQWTRLSTALLAVASLLLHGGSEGHGHHAHEAEKASSDVWEGASIWELARANYTLQFCTNSTEIASDAGGMVLAILPIESTEEAAISHAKHDATHMTEVFSSKKVTRESITRRP